MDSLMDRLGQHDLTPPRISRLAKMQSSPGMVKTSLEKGPLDYTELEGDSTNPFGIDGGLEKTQILRQKSTAVRERKLSDRSPDLLNKHVNFFVDEMDEDISQVS